MKLCPCGKPAAKRNGSRGHVPNFCEDHKDLSRHEKRKLSGYADMRYALLRKPCIRCGGPKPAGAKRQLCENCKPQRQLDKEGAAERREARRIARLNAPPKPRKQPTPRPVKIKVEPKRVPGDVRAAWRIAHKNSVIRKKYPTTAALLRGAQRGDFERVAA